MTVSLAGCFGGDDGDSNDETPAETLDDWQVHFAASSSDLPECNDDTNGRLYYIEADVEFQVCKTSGWEVIDISGTDGADGSSSTSTLIRVLSSTFCITGGNTFEIGSDSNSDGVLDVSEVGITVDICNGSQGPAGTDGTNGTNGTDGQDGANGADGANGTNGTDALNALVTSTSEPAGNNCANGGTRIDVGVDDNADGVLSETEIDQTQYVCNGGSSNNTMLTSVNPVASNLNCDAGGRVVSYGLDNGDGSGTYANGILESGEVDASTTFCSRWVPGVIKDINGGSDSSYPSALTVFNNELYFQADDVIHGSELWKSDGTAYGTVMVKDINTERNWDEYVNGDSNPHGFTVIGNILYFLADNGINGYELWKSNGTTNGTVLVKDIYSGSGDSYLSDLTAIGNTLYFRASDGTNGYELWKSDGSEAGTVMVKNIRSGSSSSYPELLTAIGNTLYFSANDGTNGKELWKSDGTVSGTVMVKDINVGGGDSSPISLVTVGYTLYFSANDGTNGTELWKSDGTASGTAMVKDINNGSSSIYRDGSGSGSGCYELTAIGNTLYFQADDGIHGCELWKSDGTPSGTVMVKDINSGSGSSSDFYYYPPSTSVGNTLYFIADDGTNGYELWKSDGTVNGTMMVKDINSGSGSSNLAGLTAIGNTIYFPADDGTYGSEPWKSDGTANGTMMVLDINSGTTSSNPFQFMALGNTIFFTAFHETAGFELFINHYEVALVITYS